MQMTQSQVFLVRGTRHESQKRLDGIANALYNRIRPEHGLSQSVLVKVHVGEIKNDGHEITTHMKPEWVRSFVNVAKRDGAVNVNMADSTVNYAGTKRTTPDGHMEVAREHGFTFENTGACFTVADHLGYVSLPSKRFGEIHIPGVFYEAAMGAQDVLILSHFKGHEIFGYGGAIKNWGMGFVGRQTKADIHLLKALVDAEKCEGCGDCVDACTHGFITLDEKAYVDPASCYGCFACLSSCKNGALDGSLNGHPMTEQDAVYIRDSLVIAAKEASALFKGHLLYVTDLTRLTAFCDCDVGARMKLIDGGHPEFLTQEDVGFLASTDPVALDQACLDLAKPLIGEQKWHQALSVFGFYRPIDLGHITQKAEELGMGSTSYKLVTLKVN